MRILLAGPDYEENLSLRYLSSSLQSAGHETVLAAFNSSSDIPAIARSAEESAIIGLSMCFQSRAEEFLHLAQLIKSRDPKKLVVMGGHYASCAAEPLLINHPEIDIIVIHEGEKTLVEIANSIPPLGEHLHHLPGIAYRDGHAVRFTAVRPMLEDLDALPFPDRRGPIHLIAGVPTSFLLGSRGCYGSCAYCCITTLHRMVPGKRFRQRNPERIADEMADLYNRNGIRQFIFHDDNFLVPSENSNQARLSELEKELRHRGVKDFALVIKCRPADAKEEILRRLKELGLVRIFFGIESSTARGLSTLERNQGVEDSERALNACAKLDISAQFTLMIFNPDATPDTLRSDTAFMRRFSSNPLNFCRAEIYAGTPLEKRMTDLGRAKGDYLAKEYSLSDPIADRACTISLDLFNSRCWRNDSLMQNAIGIDHMASVIKRFNKGSHQMALCRRVADWLKRVNLDTIDLLEEVIEISRSAEGKADARIDNAILEIRAREAKSRQRLLSEGIDLRGKLQSFRLLKNASAANRMSLPSRRLARQVAAALLVVGAPAATGCHQAIAPAVNPPAAIAAEDPNSLCSLRGVVKDAKGGIIPGATIEITNLGTKIIYKLTTNDVGDYEANRLPAGRYAVKVKAKSFRTFEMKGLILKDGAREVLDITLEVLYNGSGAIEYAAAPLKAKQNGKLG
jgi:anaerobic magnesium-protoporphyrin IX monomethyl ester cyclase